MMTDDDAAVFADELEQKGQADRANLIRWQRVRGAPWDRAVIEAAWHCDDLIAQHGDTWRAELPALPGVTWGEFRDGFVATAKVETFRRLHELADQIGAASPSMHEIVLSERNEPNDPPPPMPWLRRLKIATGFTDGPLQLSSNGSLVDRVPELVIEMTHYDQGQDAILPTSLKTPKYRFAMIGEHIGGQRLAGEIAACPALQELHALELGTKFVDYNYQYYGQPTFREEGAVAIALALPHVEVLDLTRQRIGNAGFAMVGPALGLVRELQLGVNDLTTLAPLCDGPELDRLNLYYNKIPVEELAAMPRLAELKELVLDTCEVTDLGPVIRAPWWQTLRILDLSRNDLGKSDKLGEATPPPHLHTLRLASCDLIPGHIKQIAHLPWLDQLIELSLDEAPLTEPLLARLGTIKKLSLRKCTGAPIANVWNAVHLDLSETTCTLPHHAPNLQSLVLHSAVVDVTRLTVDGYPKLRVLDLGNVPLLGKLAPILELAPQLQTLVMRGCQLGPADVEALVDHGVGAIELLDLRDHKPWTVETYVQLARSKPLRAVKKFKFSAAAWRFPQPARDELEARFGRGWGWSNDDDDPNDEEGQ
ncbi:MAG: hypothetical protein QM831_23670 [Kofleriaceae bacterium]